MSLSENGGEESMKVRLVGTTTGQRIVFNIAPDVVENRNVNYKMLEPVHMPGSIHVFSGSSSRTFNLSSVKLVSRTAEEAAVNLKLLNILRSWGVPHFGRATDTETLGPLGAPPEVLLFSAYSNVKAQTNIYKIPVVVSQFSINYPSDVDYIMAYGDEIDTPTPFPSFMTIELTLFEVHSPREYTRFDLSMFRKGKLTRF